MTRHEQAADWIGIAGIYAGTMALAWIACLAIDAFARSYFP